VRDLLPTLLDLAGVPPPVGLQLDGTSLTPSLRGQDQPGLDERMRVVQFGGLVQSDPVYQDAAILWGPWRLVGGKELYRLTDDPAQQKDVAPQNPKIVAAMREHYERWWAGVQPGLNERIPIVVGSPKENPSRLTSMDWYAPRLTPAAQPFDIRLAGRSVVVEGSLPGGRPQPSMNGPWNLEVAEAGSYRIGLRRWPSEADAAITAGVPAYKGTAGSYPEGVALPIHSVRMKIGAIDQRRAVRAGDKEIAFEVTLPAGGTQLQTWFYDQDDQEISGAFFVEVLKQ